MNGKAKNDFVYYLHDGAAMFRFKLTGNLSAAAATDLEQARLTASSIIGRRSVVADLTDLGSVDAAGHSLLLEWHKSGVLLTAVSRPAQAGLQSLLGVPVELLEEKGSRRRLPRAAEAPAFSAGRRQGVTVTLAALLIAAALAAAGCSNANSAGAPPPAPTVEVAEVVQQDVPIYNEWIGTLDGLVNADIKAQVSGYLMEQKYTEGSFVRKGQLLFQIDPRPFQAALDQVRGQFAQAQGQLAQAKAQLVHAEAQLTVAQANQGRTQLDEDRYAPLAKQQAVSQQELDNATQNNLAARAQIEAARAAVETAKAQIQAAGAAVESSRAGVESAQLNLEFTRLTAPIDGVAGIATQQVGALVSPASGPVTTVSTVDPVKAYFTVSEQEYLAFTRRFPSQATRDADRGRQQLELILADGTTYSQKGRYYIADRQVNQSTGAFRMAGLFPNPGNILRPGQYGRVRAETDTRKGALLVPQRAVSELQGHYQVAVVDPQNQVSIRNVKVGERRGNLWIIEDGVQAGERVIVEGTQKTGPGAVVNPKPFAKPAEGHGR